MHAHPFGKIKVNNASADQQVGSERDVCVCVCVCVCMCVCRGGRGEHERNDPSRRAGGSLKEYF